MAMTRAFKVTFQAGYEIYAFSHDRATRADVREAQFQPVLPYLEAVRKLSFEEISSRRLSDDEVAHAGRLPLCALLDNVRSLYNVGSVFRTADALWMRELVLTGFTPHPPRREIDKTALGATKTVPWRSFHDPVEGVKALRSEGYTVWAVELTTTSIPLNSILEVPSSLALVFGNEVTGVSPGVLEACDGAIDIPMHGTKHSLNVAVAFGIASFHLASHLRRTPSR